MRPPIENGIFEQMRHLTDTEDGMILTLLAVIVLLEVIDWVTGSLAAFISPNDVFISKKGIDGLLRKAVGIIVLAALIPVSVIFLPQEIGQVCLYSMYLAYTINILKSLFENYGKAKGDDGVFKNFLSALEGVLNNLKGGK